MLCTNVSGIFRLLIFIFTNCVAIIQTHSLASFKPSLFMRHSFVSHFLFLHAFDAAITSIQHFRGIFAPPHQFTGRERERESAITFNWMGKTFLFRGNEEIKWKVAKISIIHGVFIHRKTKNEWSVDHRNVSGKFVMHASHTRRNGTLSMEHGKSVESH